MKRIISIFISIIMTFTMLSSAVYAQDITYTAIDYSAEVTVGATVTDKMTQDTNYISTEYWTGFALGYSIKLEAEKMYNITYTVTYPEGVEMDLQPNIIVLTGGDFKGDDTNFNGDALTSNVGTSEFYVNTCSVKTRFYSREAGTYRLLPICWFDGEEITGEIKVEEDKNFDSSDVIELDKNEFEWKTGYIGNDYSSVALGPNGELAIASYYSTYTGTDYEYYLRVFNSDATEKFKYNVGYESDATPVFDENGNVYIATSACDFNVLGEIVTKSFVHAVNSKGEKIWTTECINKENDYINDQFSFNNKMYITDGVLVLKSDYNIVGFDCKDGKMLWNINNIDCNSDYSNTGLTVSDGKVYASCWEIYIPNGDEINIEEGTGYDYYCNAILKIDAKTGSIEKILTDLDNCCGANYSNLVVDENGILYFICDGTCEVNEEILTSPLYAVNTSDMSVKKVVSTDFISSDCYETQIFSDLLVINDYRSGIFVYKAETLELVNATKVDQIFDTTKIYLTNNKVIEGSDFENLIIEEFIVTDDYQSFALITGQNNDYFVSIDETGNMKINLIDDAYNMSFALSDTNIYFADGAGSGVYSLKYKDSIPDTETDTEVTDTEVTDTEVTDTEVTDTEVTDTEVTDTEVTDTEVTDTETTDTETDTDTDTDEYMEGDINKDGKISIVDVVMARAHIVKTKTLSSEQITIGDMNNDSKINIVDVVMLRSIIVNGKIK